MTKQLQKDAKVLDTNSQGRINQVGTTMHIFTCTWLQRQNAQCDACKNYPTVHCSHKALLCVKLASAQTSVQTYHSSHKPLAAVKLDRRKWAVYPCIHTLTIVKLDSRKWVTHSIQLPSRIAQSRHFEYIVVLCPRTCPHCALP